MKQSIFILLFFTLPFIISAQEHDDYLGAGHDLDVTVTSSDPSSSGQQTIDGAGLNTDMQGASRFLSKATLGYTIEDLEHVSQIGYEHWVEDQMNLPASNYTVPTIDIYFELFDICADQFGELLCAINFVPTSNIFRYAWWHNTMRKEDKLRQRVAMALSEIVVLSDQSQLINFPHGISTFYDILASNAFGNYRDILLETTLNPSMGLYLSHINNPKTIPILNIRPDENYAREIMQLFSIGLYELNQDGTRKVDMSTGLWIPTYDNEDIKGLAKVFTGLSGSKWADENDNTTVQFGFRFSRYSLLDPMKMYEEWHETGEKQILGGNVIPGGQSGMEDINDAIDILFNHENVGPFLATRLIQRLVKSNPTPAYVERVAQTFNDNGEGVRGDMAAVVKAILLDPEAVDCEWIDDMNNGMLQSPILRQTQMMTALKAETESYWFWNSANYFQALTEQHPMSSPTVFNFYSTDYVPDADFEFYNLVGPEFQIYNSSTSSNYVNVMLFIFIRDYVINNYNIELPQLLNEPDLIPYVQDQSYYAASLSDELWLELAEKSPTELVDYLDILLANGSLEDDTKMRIIQSLSRDDLFNYRDKANYAAFMIMINPEFTIMK